MIELANGAKPLHFVVRGAEGIVLAEYHGEYVVWFFYADAESGKVFCDHGSYFRGKGGLEEAMAKFKKRSLGFMGWGPIDI